MVESLVMVLVQGTTLMGKIEHNPNGVRINGPQRFRMMVNPKNPTEGAYGLEPLPGKPAFIVLKDFGFYYPVKDKELEGLYIQATTGIQIAPAGMGLDSARVN